MENPEGGVIERKAPLPADTFEESEENITEEDDLVLQPGEKKRILKNVVVISLAFMVHFTAFQVNFYRILLHKFNS